MILRDSISEIGISWTSGWASDWGFFLFMTRARKTSIGWSGDFVYIFSISIKSTGDSFREGIKSTYYSLKCVGILWPPISQLPATTITISPIANARTKSSYSSTTVFKIGSLYARMYISSPFETSNTSSKQISTEWDSVYGAESPRRSRLKRYNLAKRFILLPYS